MKRLCLLILITLAVSSSAFSNLDPHLKIQADKKANPWTHLNFNNDPNNFQFVIVSDRTGGCRAGVFAEAVGKINLLQPEFVICVGDLVEGNTEDEAEIQRQWQEFDDIVKMLQMPFFYVPGNHDLTNEIMLNIWKQRLGRPYYHFIYRNVLFLCLDTEGGRKQHKNAHISDEQTEYFRSVLLENADVRWTLVFLHRPLWEENNQSWLKFEELLANRDYTVFAGHKHQYAINIRNGRKYIRFATTGGTSSLSGTAVGAFDHIVWVTLTEKGPKLANLLLDGIYDENVTTYFIASTAKFLKDKIDAGEVITCEPVMLEGDTFTSGRTKMTITNFAPLPMKVVGSFKDNPQLTLTPRYIDLTVLPFLPMAIDIELNADEPTEPGKLFPVDFEAVITYQLPGEQRVQAKVPCKITFKKQGR